MARTSQRNPSRKNGNPPKSSALASTARTAGYSGTPLPQKLGIKTGHRVAMLNAPPEFETTLGTLPPDVSLESKLHPSHACNVIVLFARRRSELVDRFPAAVARLVSNGGLWIAWPKKASGVVTDLHEAVVREFGLATGLVDNKI